MTLTEEAKKGALDTAFEKYKKEWSDEDYPLLPDEEDAYKAGFNDAIDALTAQDVQGEVRDYIQRQATMWYGALYTVKCLTDKKENPTEDDIAYLRFHEDQVSEVNKAIALLGKGGE